MRMMMTAPQRANPTAYGLARLGGVDLQVDAHEVVVRLAVPNLHEVEINISDDNMLHVTAQQQFHRQGTRGTWTIRQASTSRFTRAIRLPESVTVEGSHAAIHDGVLTIRLPRTDTLGIVTRQVKQLPRFFEKVGRRWWDKLTRYNSVD